MTLLLENPWPVIIGAVLLEIAFAIALWRSGRSGWFGAMVAVLAVAAALVVTELLVVTETERVENTLRALAAAFERNDQQAVLAGIAPSADPLRNLVRGTLGRFTITEARITGDLKIDINDARRPPRAVASFIARATARDKRGELIYDTLIERLETTLEKQGDRWLLTSVVRKPLRTSRPPSAAPPAAVPSP